MNEEILHRTLSVNGIQMHVAEANAKSQGPLIILCHGFPELWHTWRHQLRALAGAGFHVVAPDMRGYGATEAPADIGAYSISHLVGDVVALVAALDKRQAYIVGHDWGASVAWNAALMRPDMFTAVVGMSVPMRRRGQQPPLQALRAAGLTDFYWLYFQEPGVAEAELERDIEDTFRRLMHSGSGDSEAHEASLRVPSGKGFLSGMINPGKLPAWFTQNDLDTLVKAYRSSGFRGGLNWYRNMDRNFDIVAPFEGAVIRQPALFIAGTRDAVIQGPVGEAALKQLDQVVPGLRGKLLLEGAGHWVNEERPEQVNAELLRFFRGL